MAGMYEDVNIDEKYLGYTSPSTQPLTINFVSKQKIKEIFNQTYGQAAYYRKDGTYAGVATINHYERAEEVQQFIADNAEYFI